MTGLVSKIVKFNIYLNVSSEFTLNKFYKHLLPLKQPKLNFHFNLTQSIKVQVNLKPYMVK